MRKNTIQIIEEMEIKLNYTKPDKIAPMVKKLIRIKDKFINGK